MQLGKIKILIVDDDLPFLRSMEKVLSVSFDTIIASDFSQALEVLDSEPDVCLIDIRLDEFDEQNRQGLELLRRIRLDFQHIPIIMMTAFDEIGIVIECLQLGADDFVQKSQINSFDVTATINSNVEKYNLRRKAQRLEENLTLIDPSDIIGESHKIAEVKSQIAMAAQDSCISVMITGATGTGKELVAKAIHRNGLRRNGPFMAVSIASLNLGLLESELFGHEKSAFTDAKQRRIGYFEKAKGGVLFLDEIGELAPEVQVKLLRFLENRTFCRLGSSQPIQLDLQLIAATNKDLHELMNRGMFRHDLYFRLKALEIHLPKLSERIEDIPQLVNYFVEGFFAQGRTIIRKVDNHAMEMLAKYPWPGNVRELKTSIERAIIYANYHGHSMIMPEDLPLEVLSTSQNISLDDQSLEDISDHFSIKKQLAIIELQFIENALKCARGKKSEAWRILGYPNRHSLLRRVTALIRDHENVVQRFPFIKDRYASTTQAKI